MGNTIKCKECKKSGIKNYTVEVINSSTTELYCKPVTILGYAYTPKGNTRTSIYKCSNGHTFIIKTSC